MPDRIRTYDLLLRKQTLYPAELRAHTNWIYSLAFRAKEYICGCFDKIATST